MAELAEGARLLSEYGAKVPSRVRIPLSPPFTIRKPVFTRKPAFSYNATYCRTCNMLQTVLQIVTAAKPFDIILYPTTI